MATETFSKTDEYGFERPDSFDYKMYGSFMSSYIKVLARRSKRWEELKDYNKKTNTVKRFVRKGIPILKRPNVWMAISHADLIQEQAKISYNDIKLHIDAEAMQAIIDSIDIDIPRTFPENIYFNKDHKLPRQLFNVLVAFAAQNKEIGYCQGLNYIAGLLLLSTKNEEKSYWLLKALVDEILPQYYIRSMSGLITDLAVLDELVRVKEPAVHRHLLDIGMPWAVTTTKWFICIYVEVLPIETVLRIWDCLFYEGSKILFRVAITLIRLHRNEILACTELGEVVTCFKNMAHSERVVDCHQFMNSVFKLPGKLTGDYLRKLRLKHRDAVAH